MRLLVTRPEPDATAVRAQLIGMGHEALVEPLLRIVFHPIDGVDFGEVQALIATSRNGVRALSGAGALRGTGSLLDAQALPLYAVGPGTAAAAKALGFRHVIEGPSDAGALVSLIALNAEVNAGPLVYLAGETRTGDVAGELRRFGFHVHEPVVYSTVAPESFSPVIADRFRAGGIDGVLLMSPLTAKTYARLILAHRLAPVTTRIVHYCLSSAVARGLITLSPPQVATASRPNLNEMLALIARTAPQSP